MKLLLFFVLIATIGASNAHTLLDVCNFLTGLVHILTPTAELVQGVTKDLPKLTQGLDKNLAGTGNKAIEAAGGALNAVLNVLQNAGDGQKPNTIVANLAKDLKKTVGNVVATAKQGAKTVTTTVGNTLTATDDLAKKLPADAIDTVKATADALQTPTKANASAQK